jgi:predicted enzyme related to lactoylglutathione lyase
VGYNKRAEPVFEIIVEPNRRAILSLRLSSQQLVGEITRQLRIKRVITKKVENTFYLLESRNEMKIKLTTVYVDDQDKALRFYTEVLGFTRKTDFSQGPYRWLTVASPEEPDGTELQLALNDNPAARAYQQAIFQQGQPAVMFYTDDVKGDYERIKASGAEFTMPPTDVTASTIAMLNDTCGNLIQLTQLARY